MADLKSALSNNELTAALATSLARRWGTSIRTVWRRAKAFREDSGLRSMLRRRRGPPAGVCKLDNTVESIISATARAWWKATENATSAEIYPAIVRECAGRGVPRPSRATVVRRLSALKKDPANFSAAVAAKLRDRSRLVKASYTVERALSVVQVDHTVADVFIVDPSSRKCIGRPTLTVAVDVATRCICGICLSLESLALRPAFGLDSGRLTINVSNRCSPIIRSTRRAKLLMVKAKSGSRILAGCQHS